jgi:hypothetical protein
MSGLSRTPGKRVGVNSPPRVRIPLPPPPHPLKGPHQGPFFIGRSERLRSQSRPHISVHTQHLQGAGKGSVAAAHSPGPPAAGSAPPGPARKQERGLHRRTGAPGDRDGREALGLASVRRGPASRAGLEQRQTCGAAADGLAQDHQARDGRLVWQRRDDRPRDEGARAAMGDTGRDSPLHLATQRAGTWLRHDTRPAQGPQTGVPARQARRRPAQALKGRLTAPDAGEARCVGRAHCVGY